MSGKTTWVEVEYRGEEALRLIKTVMDSKCTGQIVLNVSQGTVCSAAWREKAPIAQPSRLQVALEKGAVPHDSLEGDRI